MQRKPLISFIAALTLILLSGNVSWGQERPRRRSKQQLNRIANGVRSGQITNREFHRLTREQGHLQRARRRAYADGHVTPRERHRLHHMSRKASRHIFRAKHNRAAYAHPRNRHQHRIRYYVKPPYRRWRSHADHVRHRLGTRVHYRSDSGYHMRGRISKPEWSVGWSVRKY